MSVRKLDMCGTYPCPRPPRRRTHTNRPAAAPSGLGGEPDFAPDSLSKRSHSEYKEGKNLTDMIRENLVAERIAIDTYREIIQWLGDKDPTTRRLMEDILAMEEEHADDLLNLLADLKL